MREAFAAGIGWGDAKKQLFELVNAELAEAREHYNDLLTRPQDIEEQLQLGAQKARLVSQPLIGQLREAVGISPIR